MQNQNSSFRNNSEIITEELLTLLTAQDGSYLFKEIFSIIHERLKERNAATESEEMLRLCTYEKLQELMERGLVQKDGENYRSAGEQERGSGKSNQPIPDKLSSLSIWKLFTLFLKSPPDKRRVALEDFLHQFRIEMRSENISMVSILGLCILMMCFSLVARFYRIPEASESE
jgi:hypothetical protein